MDKKSIASYVLGQVKALGADDAECSVSEKIVTELYYESGKISMVRTNFNNALALKVIKDKRKGMISLNSLNTGDIDGAVRDVMENASHAKPDEAEGICDVGVKESFCTGVQTADLEKLYDRLSEFLSSAKSEYPQISFDSITANHVYGDSLYMNTNGTELGEDNSYYEFSPMYMACENGKTSSFNASEVLFNRPDSAFMNMGMTRRLLEETQQQIDTRVFNGKFVGSVIFTPPCVDDIIATIESNFLSDSVIINGTSLFKNSLGKHVASDILSVYSMPLSNDIVCGYRYTADGYVAHNMPLIENGVLRNFVLSRYASAKTGRARSVNDGGCYVAEAGNISLADMIKSVDRGLIVNRLSGGEPSSDGGITGVAKNSFIIENGKIGEAISETMISGNLITMLNSVTAVSAERINNGIYILPWIKIDGMTVSGK